MSDLYVIKNQHNQLLEKSGEWSDTPWEKVLSQKSLFRTPYRDAALNQRVELTVKHPELRCTVIDIAELSPSATPSTPQQPEPSTPDTQPEDAYQPKPESLSDIPLSETTPQNCLATSS